jgi:uncharacterized protein (DUF885 family)
MRNGRREFLGEGKIGILLVAVAAHAAFASESADELHRLFDDRYAWTLREFPEFAMRRGDYRYADRITDSSLAAIERRHRDTRGHLTRLNGITREKLNETDRLNYDLLKLQLDTDLKGHRFRSFLAPVDGRSGPHQTVAQMAARVRFDSYEDFANYLKRLEQVPASIDHAIELMRIGLSAGITPPKVTLTGVPSQIDALVADGLGALATPFDSYHGDTKSERWTTLRSRFDSQVMPEVLASLRKLGTFLSDEYIPNCRTSIAATDLPDGEAFYAYRLRMFTTTDMTAREIHELGLSEVSRIKLEMMRVIRSSDFHDRFPKRADLADGELFRAFVDYLRRDTRFYHNSGEELLAGYRDICKKVDAELPRYFGVLPRLPYGVREIPAFMAPQQTTAYYMSGDIRNAQPGWFYANTYALDQRPTYEMTSLAMHEAVPGHHLQIAIAQELEHVPEFRKDARFTAFVEGWALYSESLGVEMGLYANPYDDFGRLLYEMWRACRLVVDPGMHAMGWSRDKAVQFMMDNTALSELNINNEIDRYINWPGQATAYKIGELRIRALRESAESRLGERFDIRGFHDTVLGAGAIPLTVLSRRIGEWVDERGAERDSGSSSATAPQAN